MFPRWCTFEGTEEADFSRHSKQKTPGKEHKGLFYRCVDFVADLPRHQQVTLFNRLVNLFYIC